MSNKSVAAVYFLIFVAALSAIFGFAAAANSNAIDVTAQDYPFAVQLYLRVPEIVEVFFCSGTIISKRHILTTADCVLPVNHTTVDHDIYKIPNATIYFADNDLLRPDDPKKLDDILKLAVAVTSYVPIKYSKSVDSNIAIIDFIEGYDLGIEPVTLAKDYVEKDGDEVTILEYYRIDAQKQLTRDKFNSEKPIPKMHSLKASVNVDCSLQVESADGNSLICIDNVKDSGGDTGAPILIKRNNKLYQVGIKSSNNATECYTRISSYCDFIEKQTNGEVKCQSIDPKTTISEGLIVSNECKALYNQKHKDETTPGTASLSNAMCISPMIVLYMLLFIFFH